MHFLRLLINKHHIHLQVIIIDILITRIGMIIEDIIDIIIQEKVEIVQSHLIEDIRAVEGIITVEENHEVEVVVMNLITEQIEEGIRH